MSSAERRRRRHRLESTDETRPVFHDEAQQCPECDGRLTTDEKRGETTCVGCGLVVDEQRLDRGPEWRSFDDGDGASRCRVGAPTTTLLHDKGLSTHIGWGTRDSYGKELSAPQRRRMQRLRTWDERFRTKDHTDRNLKQALGEIQRMGSALGLSTEVMETAGAIYRRAQAADLLPGRSIEAIATAAVYAAARQMSTPRTIGELAAVSRVDEVTFKRAYRYIVRELGLLMQPASPQSYVGRITAKLDVDAETVHFAREILATAEGTGAFNGKSPIGSQRPRCTPQAGSPTVH